MVSNQAMCRFQPILLFSILLLSAFNIPMGKPYLTRWVITKGCYLKVLGSTNVNKFGCVIANFYKPDTLTFYKVTNSESLKMTGSLKLDVQNFDCLNLVMTADLRKTLKAKDFPHLIIRFISLTRYPDLNDQSNLVKGTVTIELAGITRQFQVDYRFISDEAKSLTLIGNQKINFSDFKIIPPRKIGSLIQTNDELDVEFKLKLKALD